MVGTCFLTVSKEFSQLHSLPVCYLVVVVFNQLILIFQVSSYKPERIGTYLLLPSSIKEDAFRTVSGTLCNFV